MKRREFIAMLGGAAVAWPVAAMAQKDARIARVVEGEGAGASFLMKVPGLGEKLSTDKS